MDDLAKESGVSMFLTIRTTHAPATDLGYLLAKSPSRRHSRRLPYGNTVVFYPEASEEGCTAALLLDIDPVGLVRRPKHSGGFELSQYTNDRPYAASSFLSVAIGRVFNTALAGRSKNRPELAKTSIPLEAMICPIPSRGGPQLIEDLFSPLGYELQMERAPLAPDIPDWGGSPYYRVRMRKTQVLRDLLRHLCVLIPVLDDEKHYWVGKDEVEKLLRHGDGWLEDHPSRDRIARRYLAHQHHLTAEFLRRLEDEGTGLTEAQLDGSDAQEASLERPLTLLSQRYDSVLKVLKSLGVRSVADLGCGEGKFLRYLMKDSQFDRIVGMDVSMAALHRASKRLKLHELSHRSSSRFNLFQGALTYRDARLETLDAVCLLEVIEHIEPWRLPALEKVVFGSARPGAVLVTTPNSEYNELFSSLPYGKFRHWDHRFEWTRQEFQDWGNRVAEEHGYFIRYEDIGPVDDTHGSPTQMGVFWR